MLEYNSQQIERFLRQCLPDFDGVFSIDTLPENPRLLECNTDPSNEPGRHWVAMCVRDGRGEFFDSFGRAPNAIFERYLNRHCLYWTFNDIVGFVDIIVFTIVCLVVEV